MFFCKILCIVPFAVSICLASDYTNKSHTKPWRVEFYPKKTIFRKSDLIDRGCVVFLKDCPRYYKQNTICARHYDGYYKTFENFCEMEYENCNSWRQTCCGNDLWQPVCKWVHILVDGVT